MSTCLCTFVVKLQQLRHACFVAASHLNRRPGPSGVCHAMVELQAAELYTEVCYTLAQLLAAVLYTVL